MLYISISHVLYIDDLQCGESDTATDNEKKASSPGFGYMNYRNNLNCSWTISTEPGSAVIIRFLTLDIESCGGCDKLFIGHSEHTRICF